MKGTNEECAVKQDEIDGSDSEEEMPAKKARKASIVITHTWTYTHAHTHTRTHIQHTHTHTTGTQLHTHTCTGTHALDTYTVVVTLLIYLKGIYIILSLGCK